MVDYFQAAIAPQKLIPEIATETWNTNDSYNMKKYFGSALTRPWSLQPEGAEIVSAGSTSLQWRHNEHNGVSNHQPHDCLSNRLSKRRSKKTSKLRVTGLCVGNSPVTGEFPAQKPGTLKMFPFDDVIMFNKQETK